MAEAIRLNDQYDITVTLNPRAAATVLCVFKINKIFTVTDAFFKQFLSLWPNMVPNGNLKKPSSPWSPQIVKQVLKKLRRPTTFTRDAEYTEIVVTLCGHMHSYLNDLAEYQNALKMDDIYGKNNGIFIKFVTSKKIKKKTKKATNSSQDSKDNSELSCCYKYWMGTRKNPAHENTLI